MKLKFPTQPTVYWPFSFNRTIIFPIIDGIAIKEEKIPVTEEMNIEEEKILVTEEITIKEEKIDITQDNSDLTEFLV